MSLAVSIPGAKSRPAALANSLAGLPSLVERAAGKLNKIFNLRFKRPNCHATLAILCSGYIAAHMKVVAGKPDRGSSGGAAAGCTE